MTIRTFRALEDDGLKAAAVFEKNKNQWKSIYDEVKDWVWQNWPKWIEEKPAWFDERMRSMIPGDMIPSSDGLKQIAAEGGKKIPRAASKVNMIREQELTDLSGEPAPTIIGRIQSQVTGLLKPEKNKVLPVGGGMTEEDTAHLLAIGRMKSSSGL